MARRRKGRFGFWGPLPSYTRQTRGGSRVRFTGCCLPLALGVVALPTVLITDRVWRTRT